MLPASMEAKHNFTDISGDDSLEELLTPNSTMAIEHDLTNLYRPLKEGQPQPAPLPLGVAVVDASIMVFGLVFPRAAVKHLADRLELIFSDEINAFGSNLSDKKTCKDHIHAAAWPEKFIPTYTLNNGCKWLEISIKFNSL